MGWYFKRSAKLGPFRLNFSKSGIGVSAGMKGARVSTGPKGTYINMGTKGLYYRQKIDPRYSAASGAGGVAYQGVTLPSALCYPTFPKHGPPRIVTTVGLLSIPAVIILVWILALIGVGTSSSKLSSSGSQASSSSATKKVVDAPVHTNRERGFRAGFDYAVSGQTPTRGSKLNQRRLKQLVAQMAAQQQEGTDWQQGWIEGYTRGFDKSIGSNANDNTAPRQQPTARAPAPTQQFRTASNGYIRGPRGGCYYLSASGRKVYVDRGLCN